MRSRDKLTSPLLDRLIDRGNELQSSASEMASVVARNIEAIDNHRRAAEKSKTRQDRIADAVTIFSGSMPFVYFHVILFIVWIGVNIGVGGLPSFDPYPFGMLTTFVSLEAIFLATFVLVSQNRQAQLDERRTELDLHINLLTEYELTRVLSMVHDICKHLGIESKHDVELRELERDIKPEAVLETLEKRTAPKDPACQ